LKECSNNYILQKYYLKTLCFFSILGLLHCPLKNKLSCQDVFTCASDAWKHAKTHGPEHFPWVCGICPSKVFLASNSLLKHWLLVHPDVKSPRKIVHPLYGTHYSHL